MTDETMGVEVTQGDREAAAGIAAKTEWSREQYRAGKRDKTPTVQAFARHRLASASPVVGVEAMREACAKVADASEARLAEMWDKTYALREMIRVQLQPGSENLRPEYEAANELHYLVGGRTNTAAAIRALPLPAGPSATEGVPCNSKGPTTDAPAIPAPVGYQLQMTDERWTVVLYPREDAEEAVDNPLNLVVAMRPVYLDAYTPAPVDLERASVERLREALERIASTKRGVQGIYEDHQDTNARNYHEMVYWRRLAQSYQDTALAALRAPAGSEGGRS